MTTPTGKELINLAQSQNWTPETLHNELLGTLASYYTLTHDKEQPIAYIVNFSNTKPVKITIEFDD